MGAQALRDLGVAVEDAAGNLRPLADIMDDFNAGLAGLGSAAKLNILGKIFSARQAGAAAELISQGGNALRGLQAALEGAGGTAARIASVQLDTLGGELTLLRSASR